MSGLSNGELLVAHDEDKVNPDRTLKYLCLDPLMEKVKSNGGSVYPGYEHSFILWIDIKSEDVETYQVIHQQLLKYQKMLTKFTPIRGKTRRSNRLYFREPATCSNGKSVCSLCGL